MSSRRVFIQFNKEIVVAEKKTSEIAVNGSLGIQQLQLVCFLSVGYGGIMSKKPKKLYLDGKDFFFWEYEDQTQMKHTVVKDYFKVWATKLGQYHTVYYFDCFGGCGVYLKDNTPSYGSPFLIAEVASELKDNHNRDTEIWVTEPDKECYENLNKIYADLKGNLSVDMHIGQMKFENFIKHEWTQGKYKNDSTPVFFFIDPFGYNLDFDDIEDIMAHQRNEMIINFMFNHISWFIGTKDNPKLSERFDRFFGTEEWREAIALTGEEREKKLVSVYKQQLKKNAKYVFPYKLSFPDKNRTYYYLFHVTNSRDGCSIMKSVFASSNFGRVEYLGKNGDVLTLFDMTEMKVGDIKNILIKKYSGRETTFDEIVDGIIDETLYLEKDIRTAIKSLKKDGIVQTMPVTSKTDRGLNGQDIIVFRSKDGGQ